MSMSSERMMKLMAYADGELEGSEKADVEKLLASDEEARRVVDAMGGLGDFVRLGHEAKVAPVIAKVDLTDAIMKKVDAEKPATNVRSLDAARAKRRNVGMGIVAALALAASVFFVTRDKQDEKPMAVKPTPTVQTTAVPQQMASVEVPNVNAATSVGVEVDAVQSPGHSVSVFYLPTANELSTSVTVWVDETAEKK
jgi:anti-sigma-K factor RskA